MILNALGDRDHLRPFFECFLVSSLVNGLYDLVTGKRLGDFSDGLDYQRTLPSVRYGPKTCGSVELSYYLISARWNLLVDRLGLPRHVIHQQVLPQRVGRGEVGFAAAHLGDFLDELHQAIIGREHEGVD